MYDITYFNSPLSKRTDKRVDCKYSLTIVNTVYALSPYTERLSITHKPGKTLDNRRENKQCNSAPQKLIFQCSRLF